MTGTSCRQTQQRAGRRYKRDADPIYGAACDIARESTKAIKRREERRPIIFRIEVRTGSCGAYVARVVRENVTASCTSDPLTAVTNAARKFAKREGLRFVGAGRVDAWYEAEFARVS